MPMSIPVSRTISKRIKPTGRLQRTAKGKVSSDNQDQAATEFLTFSLSCVNGNSGISQNFSETGRPRKIINKNMMRFIILHLVRQRCQTARPAGETTVFHFHSNRLAPDIRRWLEKGGPRKMYAAKADQPSRKNQKAYREILHNSYHCFHYCTAYLIANIFQVFRSFLFSFM